MFKVPPHQGKAQDDARFGQVLAERVAALVGSWPFLIAQSLFLLLWLVYNTLQFTRHFDAPPYILLNLLLSFQAAFTGPVLLIAANVGALRDHRQYDRIEHLTAKTEDIGEGTRDLANRLVEVERQLDLHVSQSLKAHTEELRELCALVKALHAAVLPADGQLAGISVSTPPASDPTAPVPQTAKRRSPATATSKRPANS
jgi:uncharacterized membrane protein